MTVQLTRDDDPPITGLPDQGTNTKVHPPTPALAHAEVTPEPVGSGPIVEAPYSVPLITTPDATTVAPGGTLTVGGSGLAASSTGTLALVAGPPGSTGGTVLVEETVTADATGVIPSTALAVPADAAPGEYHLVLSGGGVRVNATAITVTAAPAPTPLTAPTNVAAGTPTATEIPLTWDAVPNATAYRIETSVDAGTTWVPDATEPATNAGSATGLTAATEYQLRVTALGDGTTYTDSDPSATVTATTAAAALAESADTATVKRTTAKKKTT